MRSAILLALAGTSLPLAVGGPYRFAPDSDSTLERTFEAEMAMSFVEMRVVMNDAPVPSEYLPEMEIDVEHVFAMDVRDRFVESADGAVVQLVRSFDRIETEDEFSMSMSGMGTMEHPSRGESALEGRSVRFTRNEDGEYDRAWEGEEAGSSELLEGLGVDMDLTTFLPGEEVAEGDSWTVDALALPLVGEPGGELSIVQDNPRPDPDEEVPAAEWLEGFAGGQWTVTLRGEEELDGVRVAVFGLESEQVFEVSRVVGLEQVPVTSGQADELQRMSFEAEGTLTWNASAGHLHALELEARFVLTTHAERIVEAGDTQGQYSHEMQFEGDLSVHVRCAPQR